MANSKNSKKWIVIKGARQNNLKNIDVKIPRDEMVVFTGLSGSGKSSLAIDTIYAEGQRRYLQSLSAYARQFLEGMDKPDVDSIEGLSPTIAIEQKTVSKNPRSTVGTVTEIYDYLRLLWANIGIPHCPECGKEITPKSSQEIIHEILHSIKSGTKFKILAPVIRGKKGTYEKLFLKLRKSGYSRIIIQDQGKEAIEFVLEEPISLDKNIKHDIDVVVDRLVMKSEEDNEFRSRVANSVETSLKLAEGIVKISIVDGNSRIFSENFFCPDCGISYEKLQARDFSFNTPYGACEYCKGLGTVLNFDEAKIFLDDSYTLAESGLTRVGGFGSLNGWSWKTLEAVADYYHVDINQPIKDLPDEFWEKFLYGTGKEKVEFNFERNGGYESEEDPDEDDDTVKFSIRYKRPFKGIMNMLQNRYLRTKSEGMREWYQQFMTENDCTACNGNRLKPVSLAVTIEDKNIWQVCEMYVSEAIRWFNSLKLSDREKIIAKDVVKEINSRYSFLKNVGLDYITLDRVARTLSGGESERIRLATQIGSNLVGVLYILDEPTIGLHQRDKSKLIKMLIELKNRGNSVLIVEHDEDVIRAADFIIDIGPEGGEKGGFIVETGTINKIEANPKSITGQYLSGKKQICLPKSRRPIRDDEFIKIIGARENNLKNVNVTIPLGVFTVVTGVSGAGKSSLVQQVLLEAVSEELRRKKKHTSIKFDRIEGLKNVDKVINIDQTPIGRTPKSVPSTYTKLFDEIRDVFTATEEAKIRGYKKGRFSFNVKSGRCEKCRGLGYNLIEMHFLPDVYVKCDVCKGKRYNEETLEVKYKGKSISDVLRMTHNQALEFFENHQKIKHILQTVVDVGLGYIELGQSSTTLSGGEAQRMKLSRELSKRSTGNTLFILDEPTTGLHFHDIKILIKALQRLVDQGNSVVVIEHNLDVIKSADHIIDLGPEGGENGGEIIGTGTPEEISDMKQSYTGQYLKKILNPAAPQTTSPKKKSQKETKEAIKSS